MINYRLPPSMPMFGGTASPSIGQATSQPGLPQAAPLQAPPSMYHAPSADLGMAQGMTPFQPHSNPMMPVPGQQGEGDTSKQGLAQLQQMSKMIQDAQKQRIQAQAGATNYAAQPPQGIPFTPGDGTNPPLPPARPTGLLGDDNGMSATALNSNFNNDMDPMRMQGLFGGLLG